MRNSVYVASRIGVALAFAAVGWGPASAADLRDYNRSYKDGDDAIVVPQSYFSWNGFYLGGHLGYGSGSSSSFNDAGAGNGDAFDGGDGISFDPAGWMAGVTLGYNWQFDAFVFSLEADVGYLGADESQSTGIGFASAEYGGYGTLTGRLGYAQDRWLFYAKGGLAFADIENRAGDLDGGLTDGTDFTKIQEVHTGWALGLGIEYAFQRDLSMKIEYLYMDFGEDHSRNLDGDVFQHENDLHTVKVGVNYSLQRVYEPLR